MEFHWSLLFLNFAIISIINIGSSTTVWDALGNHSDLSKFQEMVNRDEVIRKLLQFWPVTVFAPTNEAIDKKDEWIIGRENKVAPYHILTLLATKNSFPFKSATTLAGSPPLYMNIKKEPEGVTEYYVNDAKITRSEELISEVNTKQLLYAIDEILVPYVSSTSVPPSAFDLLNNPDIYDIPEPLGAFKSRIESENLENLFHRDGTYTFFLPVGANVGHAFNRQLKVDKWVILGHIIPGHVLFTRLASSNSYPSEAYGEDIKVELKIIHDINLRDDSYTAQSKISHSDYGHKSDVVSARIIRSNIPVTNGVVHLIESPLMIPDTTVWTFLQNEKDGTLSKFMELVRFAPDLRHFLQSSQEKTLFVPSNAAIHKLSPETILLMKVNHTAITNFLKLHLVFKRSISTHDVLTGRYNKCLSADNRNSLYFRISGNEKNKTLTVEGLGVEAAVVNADIAATDGMIHVIDRVLGIPYQTIYNKLHSDPDLKISAALSNQNDWGVDLNDRARTFTFFVPSDEAWLYREKELPTEYYKSLTTGYASHHVHKILDRHLVIGRELPFSELQKTTDIQTINGMLKVVNSTGSITLEWEGLIARVIRPDVETVNGVMHVIDGVMMKWRDLAKSESAPGLQCGGILLLIQAVIWTAILF